MKKPRASYPSAGRKSGLAQLNELLDKARAASGTAVRLILHGRGSVTEPFRRRWPRRARARRMGGRQVVGDELRTGAAAGGGFLVEARLPTTTGEPALRESGAGRGGR